MKEAVTIYLNVRIPNTDSLPLFIHIKSYFIIINITSVHFETNINFLNDAGLYYFNFISFNSGTRASIR